MATSPPPEVHQGLSKEPELYRLVNWLRRQMGTFINDAPFWVSSAVSGMTGAVDMSTLGTGVLQQTVTGGVATPSAVTLPEHAVLYGGSDGLIDFDVANLNYQESTGTLGIGIAAPVPTARMHVYDSRAGTAFTRWTEPTKIIIENPDATGISGLVFVGNGGVPVLPTFSWLNYAAGLFFTGGNSAVGGAGVHALILNMPNSPFSSTAAFSVAYAGIKRFGHTIIGGALNYWDVTNSGFTADNFNGLSALRLEADAASGMAWIAKTGSNAGAGAVAPPPFDVNSAMVTYYEGDQHWATFTSGTPRRVVNIDATTGSLNVPWTLSDSGGDDHLVYATEVEGRLTKVTLGSGLSFVAGTLTATGSGGTVTAVTGTPPIVVTPASPNPDVSLTIDGSLGVSGGALQRAALSGDASAPAGSNTLTLATVNASPGTYAYATVTVNAKGLATLVAAGATPVPATRTLAATSPILIDGGAGPLDLSANRTFSHATSGVAAGSYTFASITVDVRGHLTAASSGSTTGFQPTITWPASPQVLYSNGAGSDPIGDANITIDTATHQLRIIGPNGNQAWFNLLSGIDSERYIAYWTADVWTIEAQATGAGTKRDMRFTAPRLGINTDAASFGTGNYGVVMGGDATNGNLALTPVGQALSGTASNTFVATLASSTSFANGTVVGPMFTHRVFGAAYTAASPGTLDVSGSLFASLYVDPPDVSGLAPLSIVPWAIYVPDGGHSRMPGLFIPGIAEFDEPTAALGFFGASVSTQQTGGSATAGATYTATEQAMLQKAYDCLRTFGLLS